LPPMHEAMVVQGQRSYQVWCDWDAVGTGLCKKKFDIERLDHPEYPYGLELSSDHAQAVAEQLGRQRPWVSAEVKIEFDNPDTNPSTFDLTQIALWVGAALNNPLDSKQIKAQLGETDEFWKQQFNKDRLKTSVKIYLGGGKRASLSFNPYRYDRYD